MSVEPNTLERSALERKDREELTTIAQALGAKPPSRARKAEIVQLILELTGVEPAAGAPAREAAADAPAADAAADTAEAGTANGHDKEAIVDEADTTSAAPDT
ncbi:MAG TPA: Rho termination factor N-terminal domain-containing protein, partial [Acidimicrobiales bacterium]